MCPTNRTLPSAHAAHACTLKESRYTFTKIFFLYKIHTGMKQ
jgi:hypothetical protein